MLIEYSFANFFLIFRFDIFVKMYVHSKVDHIDEEKSLFSCYRCDAGFKDEESIRKHFEKYFFHDRKEPIIDRKMYVH